MRSKALLEERPVVVFFEPLSNNIYENIELQASRIDDGIEVIRITLGSLPLDKIAERIK
jgi:hypothetical protein